VCVCACVHACACVCMCVYVCVCVCAYVLSTDLHLIQLLSANELNRTYTKHHKMYLYDLVGQRASPILSFDEGLTGCVLPGALF